MYVDLLFTLFTHSTSITLCKIVWDIFSNTLKAVNKRVKQWGLSKGLKPFNSRKG